MSKKIKVLIAALTLLIMLPSLVIPASANSAATEWEGKDANGVMTADGDCPIVVEHENLSFNIQELILDYYDVEAIDWNKSNVKAEYTFYNPSDITVTAKLSFPMVTRKSMSRLSRSTASRSTSPHVSLPSIERKRWKYANSSPRQ